MLPRTGRNRMERFQVIFENGFPISPEGASSILAAARRMSRSDS